MLYCVVFVYILGEEIVNLLVVIDLFICLVHL